MMRLPRLAAASAFALAAILVTLFAMMVGPGTSSAATGTAPGGTVTAAHLPVPMGPCPTCTQPHDAICWEGVSPVGPCGPVVTVSDPQSYAITVHYRTVDMTAKANVDYVPVQDAVLTIPAGHTAATVSIQLLSGTAPGKQFAVAFYNIVGGQLTRPQAIVTINQN